MAQEHSHVYVIAWSPRGPTKIGKADDPIQRLNDLQVACPFRLRLYFAAQMAAIFAIEMESTLHAKLDDHRMLGEWFKIGPSLARGYLQAHLHAESIEWQRWKPSQADIAARAAILERADHDGLTRRGRQALDERKFQMREFASNYKQTKN